MIRMKEWQGVISTKEYEQYLIDSEYDRNRAGKPCLNEKNHEHNNRLLCLLNKRKNVIEFSFYKRT